MQKTKQTKKQFQQIGFEFLALRTNISNYNLNLIGSQTKSRQLVVYWDETLYFRSAKLFKLWVRFQTLIRINCSCNIGEIRHINVVYCVKYTVENCAVGPSTSKPRLKHNSHYLPKLTYFTPKLWWYGKNTPCFKRPFQTIFSPVKENQNELQTLQFTRHTWMRHAHKRKGLTKNVSAHLFDILRWALL